MVPHARAVLLGGVVVAALAQTHARAGTPTTVDDQLPSLAVFNRCYAALTRQPVTPAQRYYAAVAAGKLDPVEACLKVLTDAALPATAPDEAEKVRVIQTFTDFHRTWFSADDYQTVLPVGEEYILTNTYQDPAEAALYLTRWLLTPGLHYSSVVEESSGMLAERQGGAAKSRLGKAVEYVNTQGVRTPLALPDLSTGEIVDIHRINDVPAFGGFTIPDLRGWKGPVKPFAAQGGGLIGSQSFLLLNFGKYFVNMDGGLVTPRRWSKAIVNDLLCRELPVLRTEDVKTLVEPKSTLPFRQAAGCMQCHATIDGAAGAARNLRSLGTTNSLSAFMPTVFMTANPVDPKGTYPASKPDGRLYFRSFDGTLVDQSVEGLDGLGKALANTDDLYVCAASRYFELFTGIHVTLADPAGDQTPANSGDAVYRDLVVEAGRRFRQHGDPVQLFRDLLGQAFYRTTSLRMTTSVED